MQDLIQNFPQHLQDALEIGRKAQLSDPAGPYSNVVITGLGGSGIGGRIAAQMVAHEAKVPIEVFSNYYLPAYVGKGTLLIASSYSGNTEETLAAMDIALDRGCRVVCITSGGKMLDIGKEKGLDHIIIPGGNPPRSMLAYSLTQQFFVLKHFGIIDTDLSSVIDKASRMLTNDQDEIKNMARKLTDELFGKRVIIYSEAATEAVSIRFRQQLNENSKELCWHHAIPEMNHNELVGWAGGGKPLAVVLFRHKDDHPRSQVRMDINKGIFGKYTDSIYEVWSQGENKMSQQMYLIHLGDWISLYLAEKKGVDPVEVDVITMLKSKLAEV